jgi:hypothetical protein
MELWSTQRRKSPVLCKGDSVGNSEGVTAAQYLLSDNLFNSFPPLLVALGLIAATALIGADYAALAAPTFAVIIILPVAWKKRQRSR